MTSNFYVRSQSTHPFDLSGVNRSTDEVMKIGDKLVSDRFHDGFKFATLVSVSKFLNFICPEVRIVEDLPVEEQPITNKIPAT